jgi:imidazolonepropionase-like amidohydrolase
MLKTSKTWSITRPLACLVVTGLLTVAPLAATTVLRASGMLDVRGGRLIPDAAVAMGPRIVPSGYQISMTGGHGDEVGWPPGVFELGPEQGIADGVAEVLRAVRFQIKHGARGVYLVPTAWINTTSSFDTSDIPPLVQEKARQITAQARKSLRLAIREGVLIAYGTDAERSTVGAR